MDSRSLSKGTKVTEFIKISDFFVSRIPRVRNPFLLPAVTKFASVFQPSQVQPSALPTRLPVWVSAVSMLRFLLLLPACWSVMARKRTPAPTAMAAAVAATQVQYRLEYLLCCSVLCQIDGAMDKIDTNKDKH